MRFEFIHSIRVKRRSARVLLIPMAHATMGT